MFDYAPGLVAAMDRDHGNGITHGPNDGCPTCDARRIGLANGAHGHHRPAGPPSRYPDDPGPTEPPGSLGGLRRRPSGLLVPPGEGTVMVPPSVSLTRLLAEQDPPVTYRVDRLMTVGAQVLLVASQKSGKTTMMGNLLRSLADGDLFLGAFGVNTPVGRVALLDDEMDRAMLRRWLRSQRIRNTDPIEVFALRGHLGQFDLRQPDVSAAWSARLRDVGANHRGPGLSAAGAGRAGHG